MRIAGGGGGGGVGSSCLVSAGRVALTGGTIFKELFNTFLFIIYTGTR